MDLLTIPLAGWIWVLLGFLEELRLHNAATKRRRERIGLTPSDPESIPDERIERHVEAYRTTEPTPQEKLGLFGPSANPHEVEKAVQGLELDARCRLPRPKSTRDGDISAATKHMLECEQARQEHAAIRDEANINSNKERQAAALIEANRKRDQQRGLEKWNAGAMG